MKKATDEEIIAAYGETNNVWKAAEILGMCGQSVHERLKRLKINCEGGGKPITDLEKAIIKRYYEITLGEVFDRKQLLKLLPNIRTLSTLEYVVSELGLGKHDRSPNLKQRQKISQHRKNNPNNPKFTFKGKTHSRKSCDKISSTLKNHWQDPKSIFNDKQWRKELKKRARINGRQAMFTNPYSRCKQGYYDIGKRGKMFFRSKWEANYALYLEFLLNNKEIISWEYETKRFEFPVKRGVTCYTPDFKVLTKKHECEYHEVKGWMDAKSKTKIKRMKKHFPDEKLIIIGEKEYKMLSKMSKLFGWYD